MTSRMGGERAGHCGGSDRRFGQRWCVECATPMAMMSPELAATVCFQTIRAIYRLVEAGRVHFTDGPEGVMVCTASLMKDWAGEQSVGLLAAAPARLSGV